MKKFLVLLCFIFGSTFFASLSYASASQIVTTSCGKELTTVNVDYFKGDWSAYGKYLMELDDIYCHKYVNSNTIL